MSPVLFSTYVGFIAVIVIPAMMVIVFADTYRQSTRRERLQLWQVAILVGTTMLALWTHLWVEPAGEALLIAATPLWVFCGIGIALSVALDFAQWLLTVRQRQLENRLAQAIFRP